MNTNNEFIDSYSDDINYLLEGRKFLLTHPFRTTNHKDKTLCDASFARIFAVFMIGNIEQMLQEWKTKSPVDIEPYFQNDPKYNNKVKVKNLYQSFRDIGINVDEEVFKDYLAIKYLRNVIVHARWEPNHESFITERGFPIDINELNEEHLQKIYIVNQNMMLYIASSEYTGRPKPIKRNSRLVKLQNNFEKCDGLHLVKKEQIAHIFWRNLENISERIERDIEETVLSEDYLWHKNYTQSEIDSMSTNERKKLYYLAALRASQAGFHLLSQHRSLTKDALDSWYEYWRLKYNQQEISIEKIKSSIEILCELYKKVDSSDDLQILSNISSMPENIAIEVIKSVLNNYSPLTEIEIIDALKLGSSVYKIIPNIVATRLFTRQLPIIAPKNEQVFQEAEKALQAMELRSLWYDIVEGKSNEGTNNLAFYREMLNEFSQ